MNKTRCHHLSSPTVDSVAKQILLSDSSTESLYCIMKFFTKNREIVIHMINRVFSHDVTAAILVSQNNETAAMLVSQTSPVGVELFSYANALFCSNKFAWMLAT